MLNPGHTSVSTTLRFPMTKFTSKGLDEKFSKRLGIKFTIIRRPMVAIRFRRHDGAWMARVIRMRVDTGADLSLIPRSLGLELGLKNGIEHSLMGIAMREECTIPAQIFKAKARLEDEYGHMSKEFKMWTACAEREEVPLVFGMKSALDHFIVKVDPFEEEVKITTTP